MAHDARRTAVDASVTTAALVGPRPPAAEREHDTPVDASVTTAALAGPRPPAAGKEHDTPTSSASEGCGSNCVLRGGVAAAPRDIMTPTAGMVHEARATGNTELAYSLCPEGRRPGCAAAAAAVARGSLDTSA